MTRLVLFCGGPNIFPGPHGHSVSKPLALMSNGRTVLENYLNLKNLETFDEIVLLVENKDGEEFKKLDLRESKFSGEIRIFKVSDDSSTLIKLLEFLTKEASSTGLLCLSYPDIFYFGELSSLNHNVNFEEQVVVSAVFLQTRFPQLSTNIYSGAVESISLKAKRVPANTGLIFAGHILSSKGFLEHKLQQMFDSGGDPVSSSLEGTFLKYLSSSGNLSSRILWETWLKADSSRETDEIIQKITIWSQHVPKSRGNFRKIGEV